MKKLLAIMLMLFPAIINAQELAKFVLTPNGTYQTKDGKDFVVIPFDGKTAHRIYQELASNVSSTFNSPSKVMSGVEDVSIKIRAYSDNLVMAKPLGFVKVQPYGGYYQLEFRIKDGRVRVSAPIIEDNVEFVSFDNTRYNGSFHGFVTKYFKNGKLKDDKRNTYDVIVARMNDVINRILYTSTVQDAIDNW